MLIDGLRQARLPHRVHTAHGADMGGKMAGCDKSRQRQLGQRGRCAIKQIARSGKMRGQRRRHHQITNAQTGVERFAEGADIQGALLAI